MQSIFEADGARASQWPSKKIVMKGVQKEDSTATGGATRIGVRPARLERNGADR